MDLKSNPNIILNLLGMAFIFVGCFWSFIRGVATLDKNAPKYTKPIATSLWLLFTLAGVWLIRL